MSFQENDVLKDEETYLKEILAEQCKAVKAYRRARTLLLTLGFAPILGSLIWWAISWMFSANPSGFAGVQVFVPIGVGLIVAATSAYPIKEILNRKVKIITFNNLLSFIESTRKKTSREKVKDIQGKIQTIMDTMLKEC